MEETLKKIEDALVTINEAIKKARLDGYRIDIRVSHDHPADNSYRDAIRIEISKIIKILPDKTQEDRPAFYGSESGE